MPKEQTEWGRIVDLAMEYLSSDSESVGTFQQYCFATAGLWITEQVAEQALTTARSRLSN